jgi:hypothetical protein
MVKILLLGSGRRGDEGQPSARTGAPQAPTRERVARIEVPMPRANGTPSQWSPPSARSFSDIAGRSCAAPNNTIARSDRHSMQLFRLERVGELLRRQPFLEAHESVGDEWALDKLCATACPSLLPGLNRTARMQPTLKAFNQCLRHWSRRRSARLYSTSACLVPAISA